MESVDSLFVTASMTRPDHEVNAKELERIHRTQGYSRIAVHFVIERDGSLAEGRPLDLPGCLAGPHLNPRAIQVCLIGGVDESLIPADNFTPEQRETLRRLHGERQLTLAVDRTNPLKEI